MENFWDFSVWATYNVIAVLLLSLLAANVLKKTSSFVLIVLRITVISFFE